MQAFGPTWFETGSISVHFKTPVSHLEPVMAFMSKPDESKGAQQLDIWMEHMDGRVVLEGTASAGLKKGEQTTMAESKMASIKPIEGSLLFVRHPIGTKSLNVEKNVRITHREEIGPLFPFSLQQKLEIITEYLPWFSEQAGHTSPWGRAVLPPECLNALMLGAINGDYARWPEHSKADKALTEEAAGKTPVGLFGGCEVVIHNGPGNAQLAVSPI
jgi:hypothetical protein